MLEICTGATLAPLDAVAFALLLVVADEGADDAHRVVDEEHLACFIDLSVEEEPDHLGDIRLSRAAFEAAERLLALEAAACLIDDMDGHVLSLFLLLYRSQFIGSNCISFIIVTESFQRDKFRIYSQYYIITNINSKNVDNK